MNEDRFIRWNSKVQKKKKIRVLTDPKLPGFEYVYLFTRVYHAEKSSTVPLTLIAGVVHRPDELFLKTGDVVGIAGNHWDGYSKGVNRRTRQNGLYPSYKVEEVVDVVDFPSYAEVDRRKW